MSRLVSTVPITALVYTDSARVAVMLRRLAAAAVAAGASVQGYVQHDVAIPGRSRCDMVLENIATGSRLSISEDRGPGARGCQLDADCLAAAIVDLQTGLSATTELLVLNKFGKSEVEGGGFRPLIAEALDLGIPVILGVPWRNIEPWRAFVGDLCREVRLDDLDEGATPVLMSELGLAVAPSRTTDVPVRQPARIARSVA